MQCSWSVTLFCFSQKTKPKQGAQPMKTQMLKLKDKPVFYVIFAIFTMIISGLVMYALGKTPEQSNILLEGCRQLGMCVALLGIAHFGLEYEHFLSLVTKKCKNELRAISFFFFVVILAGIGAISAMALFVTVLSNPLLLIVALGTMLTLHFCGYDMTLV